MSSLATNSIHTKVAGNKILKYALRNNVKSTSVVLKVLAPDGRNVLSITRLPNKELKAGQDLIAA